MAENSQRIVLYMEGTFDILTTSPGQLEGMVAKARAISRMGYTDVVLASWHMWADGSFHYNKSIPYTDILPNLIAVVPALKEQGSTVQNVFISVGGWNSGRDYEHIQSKFEAFREAVLNLKSQTGIDGVDWDLEPSDLNYEPFTGLLITMTQWASDSGLLVTAAPYMSTDTWIDVLKRTNTGSTASGAGFSWWNVQNGEDNYATFLQAVGDLVPHPESFLVPGWQVGEDVGLTTVTSQLQGLKQTSPGINGAFIWQYENSMKYGGAQLFEQAIETGLGGTATKNPASS